MKFMSARSFFDTNVLVYTDDLDAPGKQERALALWQAQRAEGKAVVSIQVLQEYFWTATRKLSIDPSIAIEKLMLFAKADVMTPLADDVVLAARASADWKLSFWDAMIVQMALRADCDVLFSEDMQDGRRFAGLEIVNPFTG